MSFLFFPTSSAWWVLFSCRRAHNVSSKGNRRTQPKWLQFSKKTAWKTCPKNLIEKCARKTCPKNLIAKMMPEWCQNHPKIILKSSQNHPKISQNHETLAQFWTLGRARNRTGAPLSGHPLTWPLGQICMVMGPEWTGMEACQTLCYGLVRISFFPTENDCFRQKTLILDHHVWSFLVVFSSRPRQHTFFFGGTWNHWFSLGFSRVCARNIDFA